MEVYSSYQDIITDERPGIQHEQIRTVITKAIAAVERITGRNSIYFQEIDALRKKRFLPVELMKRIVGCSQALRGDLEKGYLKTFSEIIHSEVFSDYTDMADHLLQEGYKDPAAVIIGSSLESRLRDLCRKNSIYTETAKGEAKKASMMNDDLYKKKAYKKLVMQQVKGWLVIRNDAAHGNYDEYQIPDVKLMLDGVRNFVEKYPA